jgi:predicted lipoprotein
MTIEDDLRKARWLINQLKIDQVAFDPAWMPDALAQAVFAFEETYNQLVNLNRALDEESARLNHLIELAKRNHAWDALAATLAGYNAIERIRRGANAPLDGGAR